MKTQMQFSIPVPCHETEDKMMKCGEGNFCFSCRKYVYDFTTWTKEEMQDFFQKKAGESICGKVRTELLTVPEPRLVSKSVLRRFAYALYIVFGLTLFGCNQNKNVTSMIKPPIVNNAFKPEMPYVTPVTSGSFVTVVTSATLGAMIPYNSDTAATALPDTVNLDTVKIDLDKTEQGHSFTIVGAIQSRSIEQNAITQENRLDTSTQVVDAEQVYEQQLVKLYPNPSNGEFHVNYKSREDGDVLIKVYDLIGKEVTVLEDSKDKPSGTYDTNVSLRFLPDGTYLLFASLGKEVFTQEFVVAK